MRWLQIRLGLRDAQDFYKAKAMTGSVVASVAALLSVALAASHNASWWTLAAWTVLVLAVIVNLVGQALLRGGNELWQRSYIPQPENRVQLTLDYKRPPALRQVTFWREFRIDVRDPQGARWSLTDDNVGGGAQVYCMYPDRFRGAPNLTPGKYWVSWWEHAAGTVAGWQLMDVGWFDGKRILEESVKLYGETSKPRGKTQG
jgi:hypothetical protein